MNVFIHQKGLRYLKKHKKVTTIKKLQRIPFYSNSRLSFFTLADTRSRGWTEIFEQSF